MYYIYEYIKEPLQTVHFYITPKDQGDLMMRRTHAFATMESLRSGLFKLRLAHKASNKELRGDV